MEDIVKMWQDELDASIKEFSLQAGEVAAWDRVLLKGADEISKLVTQVSQAEERHTGIEQTLDHVEQQQAELNALLDAYEAQRKDLLQSAGAQPRGDVGTADVEREKAYSLAESLNAQLDDMSRNLVSMIEEVNQMTAPSGSSTSTRDLVDASPQALNSMRIGGRETSVGYEDPIMQISAILNAHLGSLKWIDEHTTSLRDRLEALRRGQTEKAVSHDALRSSVGPDAPRSSTPNRSLRESSVCLLYTSDAADEGLAAPCRLLGINDLPHVTSVVSVRAIQHGLCLADHVRLSGPDMELAAACGPGVFY